ncbi:hypothetical protein ACROYT_G029645 [Oculina patagonica]
MQSFFCAGLPENLSQSGFAPFVVVLIIEIFIQILLVFYFVELLQRGYLVKRQELFETATLTTGEDHVPLNDVEGIDEEDENDKSELELEMNRNDSTDVDGTVLLATDSVDLFNNYPSLHTLAELFLANGARQFFEVIVLLMFISVLVNYSLAGSHACAQLLNLNVGYILAVFVWSCAFLIIFVNSSVLPFVSLITFLGGCLFLIVTFWATLHVESQWSNIQFLGELKHIGQPVVLGTVAMGGVVNILPVLFSKVKPSVLEVHGFCRSVIAGVLTCVAVIIFWAARNGVTSVIPVTKIIKSNYPDYGWIAILVQVFVIVSVAVSFLTMGAGMRHMVDSWFDSFYSTTQTNWQEVKSKWEGVYCKANIRWFLKIAILLLLFGFLFAVAALNPMGTVTVLGNATSLALNVELGVFIVLMLRRSQSHKFRHLRVSVPLSRCLYHLQYLVVVYFLFAVGFNIAEIIQPSPNNQTLSTALTPLANQSLTSLNTSAGDNSSQASLHNRQWRLHDNLINNGTL